MSSLLNSVLIPVLYLLSAVLFIVGLKGLTKVRTAKRGNLISAAAMLLAVVTTLLELGLVDYRWIVAGLVVGAGGSSAELAVQQGAQLTEGDGRRDAGGTTAQVVEHPVQLPALPGVGVVQPGQQVGGIAQEVDPGIDGQAGIGDPRGPRGIGHRRVLRGIGPRRPPRVVRSTPIWRHRRDEV